jgi:hypothetical protein
VDAKIDRRTGARIDDETGLDLAGRAGRPI